MSRSKARISDGHSNRAAVQGRPGEEGKIEGVVDTEDQWLPCESRLQKERWTVRKLTAGLRYHPISNRSGVTSNRAARAAWRAIDQSLSRFHKAPLLTLGDCHTCAGWQCLKIGRYTQYWAVANTRPQRLGQRHAP
jgi:hypothetical protein